MTAATATTTPTYMKLLRKDRTHNGLVFKEGLNCLLDTETFNENPECGTGGLYFCKEEDIYHWLTMYHNDLGFVATVTLCSDSTCVTMDSGYKLKTDRFILGPFQPIKEFMTVERTKWAVARNGMILEYVSEEFMTTDLCLAAVQQNGYAIKFVPREYVTTALCQAAVQQNGWALQHVPPELKTAALCLAAVQQNGWALQHVPPELKTAALCHIAVQQTGVALLYVPPELKTAALCLTAVQRTGWVIEFVPPEHRASVLCQLAVQYKQGFPFPEARSAR